MPDDYNVTEEAAEASRLLADVSGNPEAAFYDQLVAVGNGDPDLIEWALTLLQGHGKGNRPLGRLVEHGLRNG